MGMYDTVSTGIKGFDGMIDSLRLGDNVVWQVDSIDGYVEFAQAFVNRALADNRNIVYVRFGNHEPIIKEKPKVKLYHADAEKGFESFASEVYNLVKKEGKKTFYVFDCLTDLLEHWHSDLMIGNFFKIMCPYLFELDTVAYFAIIRNLHTYNTIAGIRETTQLLLDLYNVKGKYYIHPLKVWKRYSPTMFFPHHVRGKEAITITSSAEASDLFSTLSRAEKRIDYWDDIFSKAESALNDSLDEQEKVKNEIMPMLIENKSRLYGICEKYLELRDILQIASRELGSGFIGGKSVGMLIARKILETSDANYFGGYFEAHDSYYLGSDIFYTYVVQNGWWELHMKQRTEEGYFKYAPELKEKMLHGKFSENMQEQFLLMLEYFGQSPIIVRSSSLLEDNFGNAFAGKYESIFCVNEGSPEERYEAFENAIRRVYASTMNEDALAYRKNRGLSGMDEQMAILVQRVSGDYYEDSFFPHVAGVGNSANLYVWDNSVDVNAGMLRLVFGLGTRAVDRTKGDYVRIVCLDNPLRLPPMDYEDQAKYAQHYVDVLSLHENMLRRRPVEEVLGYDLKTDKELFSRPDYEKDNRIRALGYEIDKPSYVLDFKKMLTETEFPILLKKMLSELSKVYDYPVDIEFTANFSKDGKFKVNLLQCRPLQTKSLGKPIKMPEIKDDDEIFFSTSGNFMGGNVQLPINYVILIDPIKYMELPEQRKYEVARLIGKINYALTEKSIMLVGPGRWGTTTPSLGIPVNFSEICNMSVICEVASDEAGFMPELSYGSHFFQDLVETGIFYAAIFTGQNGVRYNPAFITKRKNELTEILPGADIFCEVIHVSKTDNLEIYSDIVSQRLICF